MHPSCEWVGMPFSQVNKWTHGVATIPHIPLIRYMHHHHRALSSTICLDVPSAEHQLPYELILHLRTILDSSHPWMLIDSYELSWNSMSGSISRTERNVILLIMTYLRHFSWWHHDCDQLHHAISSTYFVLTEAKNVLRVNISTRPILELCPSWPVHPQSIDSWECSIDHQYILSSRNVWRIMTPHSKCYQWLHLFSAVNSRVVANDDNLP